MIWFPSERVWQYGSLVNTILLDICSFPDYSIFLMCLNLSGQESSDLFLALAVLSAMLEQGFQCG